MSGHVPVTEEHRKTADEWSKDLFASRLTYLELGLFKKRLGQLLADHDAKEAERVAELACTHDCKRRGFESHVPNCKTSEIRALAEQKVRT